MALSIHEIAWIRSGIQHRSGRVFEYRVEGQSPEDEAFIANFGSWQNASWKVLRVKDGAGWTGDYPTAQDAFRDLGR